MGIVPDVRHRLLATGEPTAYAHELYVDGGHFVVRYSEAAKADLNAAIRRTLNQIEPGAAISIESMDQVVARQGAQTRFLALLFAAAGALGLLLSASGVFAVTAYSVNQRTREIGVRVALGATPGDVLKMMMFQAVCVAAAGAVAGTAGLLALQNVIRSLLFEISPADPLTLAAVVAVLALATVAAVYIPARRSLKIDPATALRHE